MTHNFNSVSVISGQWEGDNEKLSATEPCLQRKKDSRFQWVSNQEPLDQQAWAQLFKASLRGQLVKCFKTL